MTAWQLLVSVLLGLAINECSEVSPWCARRLVRWSAHHRYTDPSRADARAEELTALIDDRPGKLFKLFTALGFAAEAVIISARRAARRQVAMSREQRAETAPYSGPGTWSGLLAGIAKDQAGRLRILMGTSFASSASAFAATLVSFIPLFRGLGMMAAVPAAGMMAPGLITIEWWRRRARRRPGAWIGVVWELVAGGRPAMRLVVLEAVWCGNVVLFFEGSLLLFRSLGVWSAVPGTGIVALMLAEWAAGRRRRW